MALAMNARRTIVAVAWFVVAMTAAAAQGNPLPRLAVKCVDAEGKPVSDAEVHVFQARKGVVGAASYEPSGPHRTGVDGVATTAIAIDYDGGCFDRWLYARVPGKSVGAMRWLRFDTTAPPEPAEPVIRLEPSREVRGVVRGPEGVDVRTVRVRVLSLSALAGTDPIGSPFPRYHEFPGLRDALPERFDAAVAEDGSFVLRDQPPRPLLYLAAEGPGLAQAQWFNAVLPGRHIPDLVQISMQREAVLVATATDALQRPLADVLVKVRVERGGPGTGVRCTFEGRSDAEGRVRIGGLPAGEFAVEAVHPELVLRPQLLTLAVGETTQGLALAFEPAIEVRGVVRSTATGSGVERVGISAITGDEQRWLLGFAQTDPQGRFVLRLPKGTAALYVNRVPHGFQQPSASHDQLLRVDVQPGDKSLTELVFEIEPTK